MLFMVVTITFTISRRNGLYVAIQRERKSWVADKYWHEIRGRKWTFAWKYETKSKKVNYLTLKRLSDIHYTPYKQIKGEANPFDPEYDDYFFQRKEQQMLESLKGT